MQTKTVQQQIETATQTAWDKWAALHPNLSSFINNLKLQSKVAENIRTSEQFKTALENYYNNKNESAFLSELSEFAYSILTNFI